MARHCLPLLQPFAVEEQLSLHKGEEMSYKVSNIPNINWETVAAMEDALHTVASAMGASITEAGVAFNQFVIRQTQLSHERGESQ